MGRMSRGRQPIEDVLEQRAKQFNPATLTAGAAAILATAEPAAKVSASRRLAAIMTKISEKFSETNNMDPGEIPEELRDLTEIEEMLFAQILPIISVYYQHGG